MAGHTGPRTKCDVLRYHIGRFNELFTLEGDRWVYHSERVDAKMTADLGDMLGGLNYADKAQYGNAPYPTDPDSGGTTPPQPPSGDPLARVKAAPSQWAKWLGLTDAEAQALIDGGVLTRDQKNQGNNWWFQNGVKGRRDAATGLYYFYTYDTGSEVENVDEQTSAIGGPVKGKADEATEKACGQVIFSPYLP